MGWGGGRGGPRRLCQLAARVEAGWVGLEWGWGVESNYHTVELHCGQRGRKGNNMEWLCPELHLVLPPTLPNLHLIKCRLGKVDGHFNGCGGCGE